MKYTRTKLLENFDAEVAEKLRVYKEESSASLSRFQSLLWDVTQFVLADRARFNPTDLTFTLKSPPTPEIETGTYTLPRRDEVGHHYRLQHPLARYVLDKASDVDLEPVELEFDYSGTPRNISVLKPLVGSGGVLSVHRLTITSLDSEDHFLLAAVTDAGNPVDAEQVRRFFNLPATIRDCDSVDGKSMQKRIEKLRAGVLGDVSERNAVFFEEEMEKLNRWASDRRASLKTQLKDYDDQITELNKQARTARNLPEKLAMQKKVRDLDKKRDAAWKEYDEAARGIERQKDDLIDRVEARLQQELQEETLFTVRWHLV